MDSLNEGNCMVTEVRDWIVRLDSCDRVYGLDYEQKMCCDSRLFIQDAVPRGESTRLRVYASPVLGKWKP